MRTTDGAVMAPVDSSPVSMFDLLPSIPLAPSPAVSAEAIEAALRGAAPASLELAANGRGVLARRFERVVEATGSAPARGELAR